MFPSSPVRQFASSPVPVVRRSSFVVLFRGLCPRTPYTRTRPTRPIFSRGQVGLRSRGALADHSRAQVVRRSSFCSGDVVPGPLTRALARRVRSFSADKSGSVRVARSLTTRALTSFVVLFRG